MTEEVLEVSAPAADEAGFDIGFAKTAGQPAEDVKPEVKPVEPTEAPKDEVKTEPAPDEWAGVPQIVRQKFDEVAALNHRLKSAEGRIGAMQAANEAARAASQAGTAAPTSGQITAAAHSGEKWKQIKEDFPEWADAMDERLSSVPQPVVAPPPNLDGLRTEVYSRLEDTSRKTRELIRIDAKHDGWEERVGTPQFREWMQKQAPEVQALANSEFARDAIKMLDLHDADTKAAAKKAATEAKNKQRLEANITPQGAGGPATPTTIDDEEAFGSGFKKVAKRA